MRGMNMQTNQPLLKERDGDKYGILDIFGARISIILHLCHCPGVNGSCSLTTSGVNKFTQQERRFRLNIKKSLLMNRAV